MTDTIATIGTFDGLHRGHHAVIEALTDAAHSRGLAPLIISFTNHPLDVVAPQRAPAMLMTEGEKRAALDALKVPYRLFTFDSTLCSMTAEEWMLDLRNSLNVKAIMLGYDNTFGRDGRTLSHSQYLDIGRRLGIDIIDAPIVEGISSSAIRHAIEGGLIGEATAMLGRPYSISGEVVHGKALGRKLGFPTANIAPDARKAIPKSGVYAVTVDGLPDGRRHPGVLNIGRRPTVDGELAPLSIECHILDWQGDLYGHRLTLTIHRRLRDERRFPTLAALREAIAADIAATEQIL